MSDHVPPQPGSGQPDSSAWRPCAEGELSDFAYRVRSRKRLDRVNRVAAGVMVLLVVGVIGFTARQHFATASATIDCSDVNGKMAQYIAGNLRDTEAERIDHHLAFCLGCNEEYHRRTDIAHHARCETNDVPGRVHAVPPAVTVKHHGSTICTCPECGRYAVRLDGQE